MYQISAEKKRLFENFVSLSALQGVNMILPLITLPYLVRTLGVDNFGLINFSLSIVMYFNILVSFGFDLSATREISMNSNNKDKVSEIFSTVMVIKLGLTLASLAILTVLVMSVDVVWNHRWLYIATFGVVLGNALFPSWLYQGMERMKYVTYITVITRILFTILIFVFVEKNEDVIYVPILNSLGVILGGGYSLWLSFKLFDIRFTCPSIASIIDRSKESSKFFLSRVANNGSRYYVTMMIGVYFGNTVVGYYSMVEKLFYAFLSIGGVISQTLYPYMSRTRNLVFFKKVVIGVSVVAVALIFPVMFFNELILSWIFNVKSEILSTIFLVVFSGAVFGVISSLLGYPLLAAFGYVNEANNSLIYASIVCVIFITFIIKMTHDIYMASFSVSLFAICGFIFRLYYMVKNNVLVRQNEK